MYSKAKVVIIGGGLSGLTVAYLLQKRNINATILEASSRLGGRIQTVKGKLGTPLELGATWFADKHSNLLSLIKELGLKIFPQYSRGITLFQTKSFEPPQQFFVPESETPSYRLAGGTQQLIEALTQKIKACDIQLNATVTVVQEQEEGLVIETADGRKYEADVVISCLPPQLAASQIKFTPELPQALCNILPTVQTWMAGAIKFTLEYPKCFWRDKGFSGMLYSHAGIVVEMYDHATIEEDKFGLTGFLNGGAASYSQDVRKELVLGQLCELMGDEALHPTDYFDKIWTDEFVSAGNPMIQVPHHHNGHPLLQEMYMNGRLYFCGTETAQEFAGYMEGAVVAAKKIAEKF